MPCTLASIRPLDNPRIDRASSISVRPVHAARWADAADGRPAAAEMTAAMSRLRRWTRAGQSANQRSDPLSLCADPATLVSPNDGAAWGVARQLPLPSGPRGRECNDMAAKPRSEGFIPARFGPWSPWISPVPENTEGSLKEIENTRFDRF